MRVILTILLLICSWSLSGQEEQTRKTLGAERIAGTIKIDGVLDDEFWSEAEIATDFIQNSPNIGVEASQVSQVRVLYDDEAIYIGADLLDNKPDSILKQLTERDGEGNSDTFSAQFNCYKDGINGLDFMVSAAGVQSDIKVTNDNWDYAWNAVWWSEAKINEKGWTVEMKIPYAALRFPDEVEQEWFVNFSRNVRRTRENSYWNEVDPNVSGRYIQSGLLQGIKNIKPPLRLFFYPYLSTYLENDESTNKGWKSVLNGGMDVKLGLSDAYTLDMTLIPDFGQVQSDNQVLNLSAFEVFFDENRQFFTEGTELFSKVGLFYSRRIGSTPQGFYDIYDQYAEEDIISNPRTSRLVNATKVSGRGKNGLGIGVLNAVSSETQAIVRNPITDQEQAVTTDPLTNYNVLVFDQNLWENSSISLVNTNVTRNGSYYDANVTGTEMQFMNKKRTASLNAAGAVSQKYFTTRTELGHRHLLGYSNNAGNINYGAEHYVESDTYDPNDLGFLFNNNENTFSSFIGYRQLEPSKNFNRSNVFLNFNYSRLYKPNEFQNMNVNTNFFFLTKDFDAFGGFFTAIPIESNDFFEPRETGRVYIQPTNYNGGTWISSDYRKRFAIDANWNYRWYNEKHRQRFNYVIAPRFRFNDKLMFILEYGRYNFNNDVGWVNSLDDGQIILGRRDQDIYETLLRANYVFNNTMGLTFRLRQYWTKVSYLSYQSLDDTGRLVESEYAGTTDGESDHNTNFNAFNIDMVYRWVFSPGSEMSVVWKNQIIGANNQLMVNYGENLERTFRLDQLNSLSIKVLYFLDYRSLKR